MAVPNYFASDLAQILQQHGSSLDVLTRQPVSIHRMYIRRLKQSLDGTLLSFPTLNPTDLRRVIEHFHFTSKEVARLQAAILTSAIGMKLLDRIPEERVNQAIRQIFTVLVDALQDSKELSAMIESGVDLMSDPSFDTIFTQIATNYDQAVLTMHMCYDFGGDNDKIASAFQAYYQFRNILRELAVYPPELHHSEAWEFWQQSALEGFANAREFLESIGVEFDEEFTES